MTEVIIAYTHPRGHIYTYKIGIITDTSPTEYIRIEHFIDQGILKAMLNQKSITIIPVRTELIGDIRRHWYVLHRIYEKDWIRVCGGDSEIIAGQEVFYTGKEGYLVPVPTSAYEHQMQERLETYVTNIFDVTLYNLDTVSPIDEPLLSLKALMDANIYGIKGWRGYFYNFGNPVNKKEKNP